MSNTEFVCSSNDMEASFVLKVEDERFIRYNITHPRQVNFICSNCATFDNAEGKHVLCSDSYGNRLIIRMDNINLKMGIQTRCSNLQVGDILYVRQNKCNCPVVGCHNKTKHEANTQCIMVKIPKQEPLVIATCTPTIDYSRDGIAFIGIDDRVESPIENFVTPSSTPDVMTPINITNSPRAHFLTATSSIYNSPPTNHPTFNHGRTRNDSIDGHSGKISPRNMKRIYEWQRRGKPLPKRYNPYDSFCKT